MDDYEPIGTFNHWKRDLEDFKTNEKEMESERIKIPGIIDKSGILPEEPVVDPQEGSELSVLPIRIRIDKKSMEFNDFVEIGEAINKFIDRIKEYQPKLKSAIKIGVRRVSVELPSAYEGEWIELVPYVKHKEVCANCGVAMDDAKGKLIRELSKFDAPSEIKEVIDEYISSVDDFVNSTLPFLK